MDWMPVVTESEFLRRLHEYEAGRDYHSAIISCRSSSDVIVTSSPTSPHHDISPSSQRPVGADTDMPESECFNPLGPPTTVCVSNTDVNKDYRLARTRTWTRTSLTVTYCKLQLNLQSLSSNNNEHKVKIHNI